METFVDGFFCLFVCFFFVKTQCTNSCLSFGGTNALSCMDLGKGLTSGLHYDYKYYILVLSLSLLLFSLQVPQGCWSLQRLASWSRCLRKRGQNVCCLGERGGSS